LPSSMGARVAAGFEAPRGEKGPHSLLEMLACFWWVDSASPKTKKSKHHEARPNLQISTFEIQALLNNHGKPSLELCRLGTAFKPDNHGKGNVLMCPHLYWCTDVYWCVLMCHHLYWCIETTEGDQQTALNCWIHSFNHLCEHSWKNKMDSCQEQVTHLWWPELDTQAWHHPSTYKTTHITKSTKGTPTATPHMISTQVHVLNQIKPLVQTLFGFMQPSYKKPLEQTLCCLTLRGG
jgi:hypothetical protein